MADAGSAEFLTPPPQLMMDKCFEKACTELVLQINGIYRKLVFSLLGAIVAVVAITIAAAVVVTAVIPVISVGRALGIPVIENGP